MPAIAIDASRAIRAAKTGVEWYAYRLIEALAVAAPSDWRVSLLADRPIPPSSLLPPPSWRTRVLRWPPRFLWSQVRLAAHLQRVRPDLYFSPVHVLPFFATSPSVVTIHDVDYLTHPDCYSAKGRTYLRLTTAWAVRRATLILTPSQTSKTALAEGFGCDPAKIRVTPLASILGAVPAADEVARVRRELGLGKPYFFFVGRLERKKNVARIIEAFAKADIPDATLVLAGRPGRGYADVEEAIGRAGLGKRLRLLGWTPPETLAALLAGARALVFPSLAEGFGIPVLDAMRSGTPVITSRGIATEEVAGGAALLVDPLSVEGIAGAMRRMTEDDAFRDDLIRRGRERAGAFSWDRTAMLTMRAFEEVLGEKASSQ